jgi:hypothetical protein
LAFPLAVVPHAAPRDLLASILTVGRAGGLLLGAISAELVPPAGPLSPFSDLSRPPAPGLGPALQELARADPPAAAAGVAEALERAWGAPLDGPIFPSLARLFLFAAQLVRLPPPPPSARPFPRLRRAAARPPSLPALIACPASLPSALPFPESFHARG